MSVDVIRYQPMSRPWMRPRYPSMQEREAMIRDLAYYRAQERGFLPGHETEDWLAAEREVDALIAEARIARGFYG